MNKNNTILIVGGGIAGLTAAKELSQKSDANIIVIEKEKYLGGLAATLSDGGMFFDIGSHRLHSDFMPEVIKYIKTDLGVELLKRKRRGELYLRGRFLKYPPSVFNLLKVISLKKSIKLGISYFRREKTKSKAPRNYQEAMLKAVGKRVYETFYRDFAKKLWGMDPRKLSVDSMKRRKVLMDFKVIMRDITGKSRQFIYPKKGIGDISRKMEEKCVANKAKILKMTELVNFKISENKIRSAIIKDEKGEKVIEVDKVISTIPIDTLSNMISLKNENEVEALDWRGARILVLQLDKKMLSDNETFYFPSKEISAGRISEISKYSPSLNPDASGSFLTIEIPSSEGDSIWQMDEESLVSLCLNDMNKAGIIEKDAKAVKFHSMKLEKAYPIYSLGWKEKFLKMHRNIKKIENIYTMGRKGLFLHSNIDHSVLQGLILSDLLIKGEGKDVWHEKEAMFSSFIARD